MGRAVYINDMNETFELINVNGLSSNKYQIDQHSLFGDYDQAENRVTNALLKILNLAGPELIDMLIDRFGGEAKSPYPDILTQVPIHTDDGQEKQADGLIISNYSYKILIEAKIRLFSVNKEHNLNQLEVYRQTVSLNNNEYLFYITPEEEMPKELGNDVFWLNWRAISDLLNEYINDKAESIIAFLVKEFDKLIEKLVVVKSGRKRVEREKIDLEKVAKDKLPKEWRHSPSAAKTVDTKDDDENVIIVGGRWGERVAVEYGFYACQPERFFAPSKYMTFYYDNRIKYLFKITKIEERIEDLTDEYWKINPDYFNKLDTKYKTEKNKERKLLYLKLIHIFDGEGIKNDSKDKNGKRCAFTQKQRYTTYKKIMNAKTTSAL